MNSRHFPLLLSGAASLLLGAGSGSSSLQETPSRPNVLWITCEDMGPHIGPYGDAYAVTPNLDRFARRAQRYDRAWSNAPVCAPARTTLITGMYPPSLGAEHMRSQVRLPDGVRMYPEYLRQAGYYCTNNSKEDYNLAPGRPWDESSPRAHWRNRKAGQPFFAVFNLTITHESQIRRRPHTLIHDPSRVRLPAYHPDRPEVRHDWAQYYDNITTMDAQVGERLKELEEAGLADETVVFFYADHGSGMPRSKRWPCDSGLRVPLLIHFPDTWRKLAPPGYREGAATVRLVSFVDFAPSLLSLCGILPPEHMQGRAFLGRHAAGPRRYMHGFRGRMDERIDLVRSVTDGRFVYLRNYYPHRSQAQHVAYQFETPTTRVWREIFDSGKATPAQRIFWEPKAPEELYDLQSDPDEVRNLAAERRHGRKLEELRDEQRRWARDIRDLGFLPEGEIHSRAAGRAPFDLGGDGDLPLGRIQNTADLAARRDAGDLPELNKALTDPDPAVRFWGAMGHLIRGRSAVDGAAAELERALDDPSPHVRGAAAEAVARSGREEARRKALAVLAKLADQSTAGVYAAIAALNALDELGPLARPVLPLLKPLAGRTEQAPPRMGTYVPRLLEKLLAPSPGG